MVLRRLAYLCCAETASMSKQRRADAFEHDISMQVFGAALARHDCRLEEAIWNAPDTDWSGFDGVIVGSVWDYTDNPAFFLARLKHIASRAPLANAIATIGWNLSKTYLRDLEAKGAPAIPTLWADRLSDLPPGALHDRLSAEKIVIKPVVGASGYGQFVATAGQPPPEGHRLWREPVMVQPFLNSIHDEGELSFIFLGGRYAYALRKTPVAGEYRIQSLYDGKEQSFAPSAGDLAAAAKVMAAIPHPSLYARIDLVRRDDGQLAVMECELIEPYLFPLFDDSRGERFAEAVVEWLASVRA